MHIPRSTYHYKYPQVTAEFEAIAFRLVVWILADRRWLEVTSPHIHLPILTCHQRDGPTWHMEEGLAVGDIALSQTGLIQGLRGVTWEAWELEPWAMGWPVILASQDFSGWTL